MIKMTILKMGLIFMTHFVSSGSLRHDDVSRLSRLHSFLLIDCHGRAN